MFCKVRVSDDDASSKRISKKACKSSGAVALPSASNHPVIEDAGNHAETAGDHPLARTRKNPIIFMLRGLRDQMQRDQEEFREQLRVDAHASIEKAHQKIYETAVRDDNTRNELLRDPDFLKHAAEMMCSNPDYRAELVGDFNLQDKLFEELEDDEGLRTKMVKEFVGNHEVQKKLIADEDFRKILAQEFKDNFEFKQRLMADGSFQNCAANALVLDGVEVAMESNRTLSKFHPSFTFKRGGENAIESTTKNFERFLIEAMELDGMTCGNPFRIHRMRQNLTRRQRMRQNSASVARLRMMRNPERMQRMRKIQDPVEMNK